MKSAILHCSPGCKDLRCADTVDFRNANLNFFILAPVKRSWRVNFYSMNESKRHNQNYATWVIIGIAAVGAVALVAMGSNQGQSSNRTTAESQGASALTAEESSYDFGRISMANGKVSREFKIKNTNSVPVTATRLSTSCMCTSAELAYQGKTVGPFGMPGHGFVPSINTTIQPGDEAVIKVTFDPAAHGPAGVGAIAREVYLELMGGARLTLNFSAFVTP